MSKSHKPFRRKIIYVVVFTTIVCLLWKLRTCQNTQGAHIIYLHGSETQDKFRVNRLLPWLPSTNASQFLQYMTLEDAQLLFHRYITKREALCTDLDRVGDIGEGGYEICTMDTYQLTRGRCLIYSFGIGENWSFDDGMHEKYDCEVHSFDPSINKTSYRRGTNHYFHDIGVWGERIVTPNGWDLMPLTDIKNKLRHSQSVIDILKLDIEGSEWSTLRSIILSNATTFIKQIIMEIHTPRSRWSHDKVSKRDFSEMLQILMDLQRLGFKKYLHHADKFCCGGFGDLVPYSVARKLVCCYELFLININFLPSINGVLLDG